MNKFVQALIDLYKKLPIRPFKALLIMAYDIYKFINRKRTVIATVGGIKYELDLNESIDAAIYYDGCFEKEVTKAITHLSKEGMTVLDIGANIGAHTFRFAKLVGPTGKVIAFEPTAWAFNKLNRNMELNNFNNIILEKLALSNENKNNQEVYLSSSWPINVNKYNDAQVHPIHGGLVEKNVCDFVTLDNYIQQKMLEKIDLIKLDVDGYEYKVIQGAIETLKLHKPTMIIEMVAFTHEEVGDNIIDMVYLLSKLGYSFFSVDDMQMLSINFVNELLLKGEGLMAIVSQEDL